MTGTKCRLLVLAIVAALAVAPVLAQDLFTRAVSAERLRTADGLIWDVSTQDADPHWTFDGEWALRCEGGPCSMVAPENVRFDLALTMVRPDGGNSHSHTFSDFIADEVMAIGDDLIILGTVVGTGGVGGLSDVIVTIEGVTEQATLLVEFPGNDHLVGPLGGVTVRSR